jgi:hypothetical protein
VCVVVSLVKLGWESKSNKHNKVKTRRHRHTPHVSSKLTKFFVNQLCRTGPMAGETAVLDRQDVFIFGHNLANANLMDFVKLSDEFYIEWIHPDQSRFVL